MWWWRGVDGCATDISGQLAAPILKGQAVHEALQEAVFVLTLVDGLSWNFSNTNTNQGRSTSQENDPSFTGVEA